MTRLDLLQCDHCNAQTPADDALAWFTVQWCQLLEPEPRRRWTEVTSNFCSARCLTGGFVSGSFKDAIVNASPGETA